MHTAPVAADRQIKMSSFLYLISELHAVWEQSAMAQHVKPCQVLQFPSCVGGEYHPRDELN